jgi:hypothetical protein
MNKESCDAEVKKILCSVTKKDVKPDIFPCLQKKLEKQTERLSVSNRQIIDQAFHISRKFWHVSSRPSYSEILVLLEALCSSGFYETAEQLFKVCVTALVGCDFSSLRHATPSVACITLWQKTAKIKDENLYSRVDESPREYYDTVWCDWYIQKAPVNKLLVFAEPALRGLRRAPQLPDAATILMRVLERDKKTVLMKGILAVAAKDSICLSALILGCSGARQAGEAYAREFGAILSREKDGIPAFSLKKAVQELVSGIDGRVAIYASQFAAHVMTAWCLIEGTGSSDEANVEPTLLSIGTHLLAEGKQKNNSQLWIAGTTESITHAGVVENAKITVSAAMEIAQALRTAQTGGIAADALWSAAHNLGLRELETQGSEVIFNPLRHEDSRGGLLRGDAAYVIHCGWEIGETVVVRAQVDAIRAGNYS